MTISLEELATDCNLGRVVDVGTHALIPFVALAKLVVKHAILLASRLRL